MKLEILEGLLFCEKLDFVEEKVPWNVPEYLFVNTTEMMVRDLK